MAEFGFQFGAPHQKKPEASPAPQMSFDMGSKIRLVEQRLDTIRDRIELIDNSMIETHKSVVAEVNDLKEGLHILRAELDSVKDVVERVAVRLESFASRDELKVLNKYVDLWQPMQFVTRREVDGIVKTQAGNV